MYRYCSETGSDSLSGVINDLFQTFSFSNEDLLYIIDKASHALPLPSKQKIILNKKTNGKTYDLDNLEYDQNMIAKIYDVMKDGIPRTTQSYYGKTSVVQTEIYNRFGNRVSERVLSARFSDLRTKTLQKPSILFATDDMTSASGKVIGKMRFYFMVFDGLGNQRRGMNEVPKELCPKWSERRF